jgi:hypothetical protein
MTADPLRSQSIPRGRLRYALSGEIRQCLFGLLGELLAPTACVLQAALIPDDVDDLGDEAIVGVWVRE